MARQPLPALRPDRDPRQEAAGHPQRLRRPAAPRCPLSRTQGEGLLDTLDAESHKHDAGVSEDLKYALRDAIELLGNEAARQLIEEHGYSYTGTVKPLDAGQLSTECVRLVYRLIFLFYIEARPELGYVPINKSDVYTRGYSLEHLRDLTLTDLHTTEAQNGGYFDKTLASSSPWWPRAPPSTIKPTGLHRPSRTVNAFELAPLDSKLFDPASTPLLNKVRFPNHIWQAVLRGLSFAKDPKTRRTRRVSYQALSINQLGAVYEALLSYRGFFAAEDLYEVMPEAKKPAAAADDDEDAEGDEEGKGDDYGGTTDLLANGWFVTRDKIGDYKNGEKVTFTNAEGRRELRVYPKGTFIYRLAGRDRQKSASYYTPQSLTQCLVKYALKELLADKTADEILDAAGAGAGHGQRGLLERGGQPAGRGLPGAQAERGQAPHPPRRTTPRSCRRCACAWPTATSSASTSTPSPPSWPRSASGSTPSMARPTTPAGPKPARVPWFGYQLFTGNSPGGRPAPGVPRQPAQCPEEDQECRTASPSPTPSAGSTPPRAA